MSEYAPKTHEHSKDPERGREADKSREKIREAEEAGKKAEKESRDSLEAIRSSVEKQAESGKETLKRQTADQENTKDVGPAIIDRTVKRKAYKKELQRVRTHLPKSQRTLSKVIHNPTVEAVSEVGSRTVARPSGLLGGGIAAFVGTIALVLISRHYGFTYNFFVYIALLAGGFLVGLIFELIIRGLRKGKS